MIITTKADDYLIFQALNVYIDMIDADLADPEGSIDEEDKPSVIEMLEASKRLRDRYREDL